MRTITDSRLILVAPLYLLTLESYFRTATILQHTKLTGSEHFKEPRAASPKGSICLITVGLQVLAKASTDF